MSILPFALQAVVPRERPLDLALAAAAELHDVDEPAVDRALDELADALASSRHESPADQVAAVAHEAARFERPTLSASVDDLFVDTVLRTGCGHPLALGLVLDEAARRAGLGMELLGDGLDVWPAHVEAGQRVVVDLRSAVVRLHLDGSLRRQCGHQTAWVLLREMLNAALRTGDLGRALRIGEMRLHLPLGERPRAAARAELDALRARLN